MSEYLNIYQRINAVMRAVAYVQKDKDVTGGGQNYKAVTHDKVVSVIRGEMVKAGIVMTVAQSAGEILIQRDTTKDVKMHLYSGTYIGRFCCIDKPEDAVSLQIMAHAADNGDKAPGKCITYATKALILKTFMLETGEDEESRAGADVDTEAVMMAVDAITDLDELRAEYKRLAAVYTKAKDVAGWKQVKAQIDARAATLKGTA